METLVIPASLEGYAAHLWGIKIAALIAVIVVGFQIYWKNWFPTFAISIIATAVLYASWIQAHHNAKNFVVLKTDEAGVWSEVTTVRHNIFGDSYQKTLAFTDLTSVTVENGLSHLLNDTNMIKFTVQTYVNTHAVSTDVRVAGVHNVHTFADAVWARRPNIEAIIVRQASDDSN